MFPGDRRVISGRGSSGNWEDDEVRRRTRESLAMFDKDDTLDDYIVSSTFVIEYEI